MRFVSERSLILGEMIGPKSRSTNHIRNLDRPSSNYEKTGRQSMLKGPLRFGGFSSIPHSNFSIAVGSLPINCSPDGNRLWRFAIIFFLVHMIYTNNKVVQKYVNIKLIILFFVGGLAVRSINIAGLSKGRKY
jgi:hypothetical protein